VVEATPLHSDGVRWSVSANVNWVGWWVKQASSLVCEEQGKR